MPETVADSFCLWGFSSSFRTFSRSSTSPAISHSQYRASPAMDFCSPEAAILFKALEIFSTTSRKGWDFKNHRKSTANPQKTLGDFPEFIIQHSAFSILQVKGLSDFASVCEKLLSQELVVNFARNDILLQGHCGCGSGKGLSHVDAKPESGDNTPAMNSAERQRPATSRLSIFRGTSDL